MSFAPAQTSLAASEPDPLKIVHIITRLIRGGADENTLLSCNAQAKAAHDVHLIVGRETHPLMLEQLHPAVTLHRAPTLVRPLSPKNDIAAALWMWRLLRRMQPDIVHTHTSKAGVLGRVAAIGAGLRGIVHGVHILPFLNVGPVERTVYLAAERALAPGTRAFVNVSQGMLEAGLQHRVGAPERHVVAPSGMDIDRYRNAKPLAREELAEALGVSEALLPRRLVLLVAAMEPRKRQYEFLEVFASVSQACPDASLILLGEGHDMERVRARADELGLKDKVFCPGFRADVERWIATADVCAFASEREGLPRSVIQYALGAKPIVSTRLPGIEAVVKDGETGYLVEVDQLGAMAAPIVKLLSNEPLAHRFHLSACNLNLAPWGVEVMVDALERVYRRVSAQVRHRP